MNINGYIPSRQRIDLVPTERSFEELAWGPNLLMNKQAGLQKELNDFDAGLNFDYNQIDDPTISPLVEDLQKGLYDISSKIATQGFTPQTAQEVQAYKQRYNKLTGLQGPIGRAVRNQKAMNSQWLAWDKEHEKDPLSYRNKAKEAMLSTYKGFQNGDFKPGDLPNYYDVNKDILDVLTRADGSLGQMVGQEGSSIKRDPATNTFKVWNSNRGQFMDNSDALTGGATAILNDYMGAHGTDTDRSKFAKMMGITPEYIESNLDALARSQRKASYSQLPSESASYQNIPQTGTSGSKGKTSNTSGGIVFPAVTEVTTDPKVQREVDKENSTMQGAFVGGTFNPDAAKRYQQERDKNNPIKRGLSSIGEDIDWFKSSITGKDIEHEEKPLEADVLWNKYKTDFEPLYKSYKDKKLIVNGKPISNDEEWFNYANSIKQNNAAFLDSKVNLANPNLYDDLNRMVRVPESGKLFESEDGDKLSWKEFNELYDVNKIPVNKMTGWLDSDGNTIVQIPNKKGKTKDFKVLGIPDQSTGALKQTLRDVKQLYNDYNWTPEEIATQNKPNTALPISDNLKLKVYVDPNNPAVKSMFFLGKVPVLDEAGNPTGDYTWEQSKQPATKSEIQQIATFGENTILSTKFK